ASSANALFGLITSAIMSTETAEPGYIAVGSGSVLLRPVPAKPPHAGGLCAEPR
ncbi:hypothetical protein GBF38_009117, partial [Nibea albiflora]